jgi:hypothetical protein
MICGMDVYRGYNPETGTPAAYYPVGLIIDPATHMMAFVVRGSVTRNTQWTLTKRTAWVREVLPAGVAGPPVTRTYEFDIGARAGGGPFDLISVTTTTADGLSTAREWAVEFWATARAENTGPYDYCLYTTAGGQPLSFPVTKVDTTK